MGACSGGVGEERPQSDRASEVHGTAAASAVSLSSNYGYDDGLDWGV